MNEIRISQAVRAFGTGSIVDFPDLSLMMMSPDIRDFAWGFDEDGNGFDKKVITDDRLQKLLGIDYFVIPPSKTNKFVGVRSLLFPGTGYCPNCKTIYDLNQLSNTHPAYAEKVKTERNGSWFCVRCFNGGKDTKYSIIPSRFIIATEFGLIDDFPWDWFCHREEKYRINRKLGGHGSCSNTLNDQHLKIEFQGVALSEIFVKCRVCDARESLGPIFDSENPILMKPMNYMMDRNGRLGSPWKGLSRQNKFWEEEIYIPPNLKDVYRSPLRGEMIDNLKKYFPRVLQRGAGNVYFPANYIGFVLPKPNHSFIDDKKKEDSKFEEALIMLVKINKGTVGSNINTLVEMSEIVLEKLPDKIDDFCKGIGIDYNKFLKYLELKTIDVYEQLEEKNEISRLEEFLCFTKINENATKEEWFKNEIREVDTNCYSDLSKFLEKVVILHKVKQLNILRGFTRVRPLAFDELILAQGIKEAGNRAEEYRRIVDVRKSVSTNWLPCSEVKGEGILLVFKNDVLKKWAEGSKSISDRIYKRSKKLSENYRKNLLNFDPNLNEEDIKDISPRYILLHTLSHLLINSISKECGYNAASISEIIYCSKDGEAEQEKIMNGILIYTSTPDAEGSLGGLAQMGGEERLQKVFKQAIEGAKWCSSDPICIETESGQGFMGVNLASCYACSMVPETSCETMNRFLDRGLIVGTIDYPEIGFFNKYYL